MVSHEGRRYLAVMIAIISAGILCYPGTAIAASPGGGPSSDTAIVYGTVMERNTIPLQPIVGALVEIPELGMHAYTDSEGGYSIEDVPWGHYLMRASAAGFTSKEYFSVGVPDMWGGDTVNVNYQLSQTPTDWLLMFYIAYENNLDSWINGTMRDLTSAMVPTDSVRTLALIDRNSNWSDAEDNNTRLYEFRNNEAVFVQDMGEQDLGAPQTLSDFIALSMSMYPASRYMVQLADHGYGWEESCSDESHTLTPVQMGYPLVDGVADCLTTTELRVALSTCQSMTGELIDVFIFNACSMQQIEVAYEIRQYVRVLLGSEVESLGMNLTMIVADVVANSTMNEVAFGVNYVNRYEEWYTIPEPVNFEATYSALDLLFVEKLSTPLDDFSRYLYELLPANRNKIETCRAATQSTDFEGIDLFDFITRVEQAKLSKDKNYLASIRNMKAAFQTLVLAEFHNEYVPNANGLAIFHPVDFEYNSGMGLFERYEEASFGRSPQLVSGSDISSAVWWLVYLHGYLSPYDTVKPCTLITLPTTDEYYTTNIAAVDIGGLAYDAFSVMSVEWRYYPQTTWYPASGTTEWSFTADLNIGTNILQVGAYDPNGNFGYKVIIVTYTP